MNLSRGRRVVFKGPGLVDVDEYDVRPPRPNEVLIISVSTLISPGTETAFLMALPNTPGRFPQHPGYSNVGFIASVGYEVKELQAGFKVASRSPHASHILISKEKVLRIPEDLSFDEASFFSLCSIALQGVRKADVELGDPVAVIGQGLVGQLALQLAKLSGGMPVIGIDIYDYRLQASLRNGADYVVNPLKVDVGEEVRRLTGGLGAEVVVEATGNPDVIPLALKIASRNGRVVILGSPRGDSKVNFYLDVHRRGVSIIGAHNSVRPCHESYHRLWTERDDDILALKLIGKGALKVKDLISLKVSFNKAPEAYKALIEQKDRVLGVILDWVNL